MRILILLRDLSPNGITTYNRIIASELQRQGHEVFVWPSDNSIHSEQLLRLPILHHWLEPLVRRVVARIRPDVIYVNHYSQARVAHRLRETTGIPWFACMHNGHSDRRMAQWAALFDNVSGIVTMCETLRDTYMQLVDTATRPLSGHAPTVLLSRLPITTPAQTARLNSDPLTLAYCSRLSGQKGPRCESWLRAIASLPNPTQYRVMVIGGGSYLGKLRQVAAELGLTVEFTDMVTDTGPYLARVHVLAGAGYSLMEGLVRGCSGLALGFGGCFGAVTSERLDAALAVNFGDHCRQELACDVTTIARELQIAIGQCGNDDARLVTERCIQLFAAPAIVGELVSYIEASARPAVWPPG